MNNRNSVLSVANHLSPSNIGKLKQVSKTLGKEKELNKLAKNKRARKRGASAIKRFTNAVTGAKKNPNPLNREWMLHAKMPGLLRASRRSIPNGHTGRVASSGQVGRGPEGVLPWGRNWKGKEVWEYNHWTKRDWALFRMTKAIKRGDNRKPTEIFKELMSKDAGSLAMNGGY